MKYNVSEQYAHIQLFCTIKKRECISRHIVTFKTYESKGSWRIDGTSLEITLKRTKEMRNANGTIACDPDR